MRWKKLPDLDYRHKDFTFNWINLLSLRHLTKAHGSSDVLLSMSGPYLENTLRELETEKHVLF